MASQCNAFYYMPPILEAQSYARRGVKGKQLERSSCKVYNSSTPANESICEIHT
jgi:hypothetical protein